MLHIRYILILSIFISCRSSRVVNSIIPPTTFEADSSLFVEINNPKIAYYDLSGIIYLTNSLERYKQVSFLTNKPKLVWCGASYSVVNPGENIKILIDQNKELIFQSKDDKNRTNELAFLHNFQIFYQKIKPQFPGRSRRYSIDTILLFEQKVKSEIPSYINRSHIFLDSLAIVYNISDSFKTLCNSIFKNEQYAMLYDVYNTYKEELKENNLYLQKLKEILPLYNNVTDRQEIDVSEVNYLVSFADNIMRTKINDIQNKGEIKEAIDTINNYFKNLSRDFLLSKLLYHAIYKKIQISKSDIKYYRQSCKDADYKKIIDKLYTDRKKYDGKSKEKKDNRLIALYDLEIYSLDEIINQQKGKLILIDLWASWCVPCLEQIPYSEMLKHQFSNEKICFLYLSTDRQMLQWQHKNKDIGIDPNFSYLFENFSNQSFLKKNNVETVPRYILLDQKGKIINADAPRPSDPELKKLIKDNLKDY